jgi:hypothetical protein
MVLTTVEVHSWALSLNYARQLSSQPENLAAAGLGDSEQVFAFIEVRPLGKTP